MRFCRDFLVAFDHYQAQSFAAVTRVRTRGS
jgi:hypothetical protein